METVLAALIAGLLSLGGVWLGHRSSRKTAKDLADAQDRQQREGWLRDNRLQVSTEVLDATQDAAVAALQGDPESAVEERLRAGRALSRLLVLAPDMALSAQELMNDVERIAWEVDAAAADGSADWTEERQAEESRKIMEPFWNKHYDVAVIARHLLGVAGAVKGQGAEQSGT